MKYKYLFGPVPSRRLGLSLGVDLVPHKVCSLNCIYCESGKTTKLTNIRDEYIDSDLIISELTHFLEDNPVLDYITFSGQGEPLLNKGLGKIIGFIKENYNYKVALITNSTLIYKEEVREEINKVDLLLPSLDGATETSFKKINRPVSDLNIQDIINGLAAFNAEFNGEMWLEVFIVPGINDTEEELKELKNAIRLISPKRLQLNTLDRPGVVDWIEPADLEALEKIKESLSGTNVPIEIIAKFKAKKEVKSFTGDISDAIVQTIQRRPCTTQDLMVFLGVNEEELSTYTSQLIHENKIEIFNEKRGVFFRIKK